MNNCHLTKKLRSGKTILNGHYMNNLYGNTCKSSFQLSSFELVLKKLEDRDIFWMSEFYCTVKKLDDTLIYWSSAHEEAFQALWNFFHGVSEIKERQKELDERGNELEESDNELEEIKKQIRFYKTFILEYSIRVLKRFLQSNLLLPLKASQKLLTKKYLELLEIALRILLNFFKQFEYFAERYAEDQSFINCLFYYLKFKETWYRAFKLLKYLILTRKNPLDFSSVENFPEIVMELNDVQFGHFCKILTLSKFDVYQNKISFHAPMKEKENQDYDTQIVNHDVILKIPKIISRLIDTACATPCVPSFSCALPNEIHQWLKWFLDQLNAEKQYKPFIGSYSEWVQYLAIFSSNIPNDLKFGVLFKRDALCVLDILLDGKYRKEVQKELVELKLIPRLSNLFDQSIWHFALNDIDYIENEYDTFFLIYSIYRLRIQMLKLIHNFCDHSEYRLVMLSPNEYDELQSLRNNANVIYDSPWLTHNIMCVGNKGVLSKLVEVFINEIYNFPFQFWLTQAIVSFLRSSSSAEQQFLLRRNLLQYIIQNLVLNNVRDKKVLQGSFDLLGELVKFNPTALKELNSLISNSRIKEEFTALMNNHIVDSNIFVRCIILSYEFFSTCNDKNTIRSTKNTFLFHYSHQTVRFFYLLKVLSVINIRELTDEHVCCVNTILIILIFALRKGEIPQYLRFLVTRLGASLLLDLKTLLLLWQEHYLQKKNFTVLEKSTKISFQEWKSVVSLLTSDDCKNPCTISFYTVPSGSP